MKSVMQNSKRCLICGSYQNLEKHHVFGASNRDLSERYGLWVYLCHICHNEAPIGVHHNKDLMDYLHQMGQRAFESNYEEDFVKIFGRNYL